MKEALNNLYGKMDLRESEIHAGAGLAVTVISMVLSTRISGARDAAELGFAFTMTAIGRDVGRRAVEAILDGIRRGETGEANVSASREAVLVDQISEAGRT